LTKIWPKKNWVGFYPFNEKAHQKKGLIKVSTQYSPASFPGLFAIFILIFKMMTGDEVGGSRINNNLLTFYDFC